MGCSGIVGGDDFTLSFSAAAIAGGGSIYVQVTSLTKASSALLAIPVVVQ